MWILIAIVVILALALAWLVWRRTRGVADDIQSWKHGLAALGRTAERPARGDPAPRAPEAGEPGDTVRVLGRGDRERDNGGG